MSESKFCKDCKFEKRDPWSYIPIAGNIFRKYSSCYHPTLVDTNLVTGEKTAKYYCSTSRMFDCGKEATLFEPK